MSLNNVEIVANDIYYKNYEISLNITIEKNRLVNLLWVVKDESGTEVKSDCSSLSQAFLHIDKFLCK